MPIERVDLTNFRARVSGGLWTCLMQIEARLPAAISQDASNPEAVEILAKLLEENEGQPSKLARNAQPNQTAIILFPEYAFGSEDWGQIDEIVRKASRDLIVVATFGASPINQLAAIQTAATNSATTLSKGWLTPIAGDRLINFGAVWVKNGNQQVCVLFGKRYAEQGLEAPKLDIIEFSESAAIELEDMWLFPSICADLVKRKGQDGSESVISEITSQNAYKPALYTASLLQSRKQASRTWSGSINGLAFSLGQKNAAILVCNVATKAPDNRDGADKWRNLTGIYLSSQVSQGNHASCDMFSFHQTDNALGWTGRSWYPQIMLGTLRFPPYSATTHLHPWQGHSRLSASPDLPKYEKPPAEEDILLYCCASGVGPPDGYNLLKLVWDHVISGESPKSIKIAVDFLHGPFDRKSAMTAPLLETDVSGMKLCLQATNALLSSNLQCEPMTAIGWQSHPSRRGHLTIESKSVAMWISGKLRGDQMLEKLRNETEMAVPSDAVTIFGRGIDLQFDHGDWHEICLDRTEASAEEGEEFFDLPVSASPPRSSYIKIENFSHINRFILGKQAEAQDQNEFSKAFEIVINKCKGWHK